MPNTYLSNYASPNIVIVPTVSFCGPAPKKPKLDLQKDVPRQIPAVNNNNCYKVSGNQCVPSTEVENSVCNSNSNSLVTTKIDDRSTLLDYNTTASYQETNFIPVINNHPGMSHPRNQNITPGFTKPYVRQENNFSDNVDVTFSNVEREEMVQKTLSWASNYLKSIGQHYPKTFKVSLYKKCTMFCEK